MYFKRLQFPVWLAFAMIINKSQGQSLSVCMINLEKQCFLHGQFSQDNTFIDIKSYENSDMLYPLDETIDYIMLLV
ncbi:Uncharacterized protein FWK35_00027936 [Aphis craccivora]|uniref:ATP-dependent DNA helicase PIF1-like n=1 Tax=Aphis craccivora TaxID=307492 RepID=A0A6G0VZ94_APHCR|nr:Uncharacterized protein FWK35_00027936 [Aphis craccivora]